jgi:heptosyltransferase-2
MAAETRGKEPPIKSPRALAERILIVGPSWVGDMVMAQSLFRQLRADHPGTSIDVLAPAWTHPLLERMPEVRQGIVMPLGHGQLQLRQRYRLGVRLRDAGYDWCILLPNSLKSALVPFWARIPRRTGYVGEMRWGLLNDARRLDRRALPMTVQRFVALGLKPGQPLPRPLPVPALQTSAGSVDAALEAHGIARTDAPVLALCPGAEYGPAKRWPQAHYAAVARDRIAAGWQVWLFGSAKDQAVSAEIQAAAGGGCLDLTGRTSLAEAIDLLSLADAVVSNDSGLMHVAAALERPLVAVYGSSDPGFTPPLNARKRILSLDLDCSPCFRRECPQGHLDCLVRLTPERVLAALEELRAA